VPITGKFLADFSSFLDAVNAAEVSLRSFETGASKVEKQLNKTADAFSGRKILSEAELAVRAVNDIGGATKLTESEQRKLNATLTEAIAKTRALGYEASADMLRLADATKQVDNQVSKLPTSLSSIKGALTGIAGAFGIAFSIGAVVNFGKKVFDSASQIHDLSEQLGISAEAVQGFKFAAEQSGSSLETVSRAITKMNEHLSQGDKSTVKALQDAGVNFQTIRNLKPEDAFLAIADAIQKIPDPMKQSELALQLFGKSGAELLPGIKEGFRGISDAADKMSDDTINSLEAAQDAWGKLADKVVIVTGTIIAETFRLTNQVTSSWKNFLIFADNVLEHGIGVAGAMADLQAEAAKIQATQAKAGDTAGGGSRAVTTTAEAVADTKAAEAARHHADAIRDLAAAYAGTKAINDAKDALAAVNLNLRRGIDIAQMTRDKQEAVNKTVGVALEVYRSLGREAPESLRKLYADTLNVAALGPKVEDLGNKWAHLGEQIKIEIPPDLVPSLVDAVGVTTRFGSEWGKVGEQIAVVVPKIQQAHDHTEDLTRALFELSQISGGAFGNLLADIGTFIDSIVRAKHAVDDIQHGLSDMRSESGNFLAGLAELSSGILGIASAAITAGKAIANLFDRNKGRDLVTAFAGEHGGFDALHNELLALDKGGEQLWINLTQGVGRNNPAEALAAIDAIKTALGAVTAPKSLSEQASDSGFKTIKELQEAAAEAQRLFEFMRDSGEYSAEAVQAAWERANAALIASGDQQAIAAQKAHDAIAALDSQIKSLTDSIANEAPEEVMGVVEAQTRAQIAALEEQRAAAQHAMEESSDAAAEAGHKAADAFSQSWTDAAAAAEEILGETGRRMLDQAAVSTGEAANDGARLIQDVLSAHEFVAKLRFEYEVPELGNLSVGVDVPGFAGGTKGQYLDFGAGTTVRLHGRERVMTEGEYSSDRGGGGGTAIINIDGRRFARIIVPHIPDVVQEYGLR